MINKFQCPEISICKKTLTWEFENLVFAIGAYLNFGICFLEFFPIRST